MTDDFTDGLLKATAFLIAILIFTMLYVRSS